MILPNFPTKDNYTVQEIKLFGEMRKEKIKLSDAIFVIDVCGYIGSATKGEIELAKALNKEIIYYSKFDK